MQGSTVRAQPTDSLISAAMTGVPSVPDSVTVAANTEPAIASQNGLGALAFRAGLGLAAGQERPNHLLVAPPRRWDAPAAELTAYLQQVGDFLNAGAGHRGVAPVAAVRRPGGLRRGRRRRPGPGAAIDPAVVSTLARLDDQATGMASAMQLGPDQAGEAGRRRRAGPAGRAARCVHRLAGPARRRGDRERPGRHRRPSATG